MTESPEIPDRDAVAASLRYLRQQAHMSQAEVADAVGAHTQAICQFEQGKPVLGREKIAQLPPLFGCDSLQAMVEKAAALPHEPGRDAIAASLRYLREQANMSQAEVADAIGTFASNLSRFEQGKPVLGREKIALLPPLFGCDSLQAMVEKANKVSVQFPHLNSVISRSRTSGKSGQEKNG